MDLPEVDGLMKRFEEIKATEAATPSPKQVEGYVALYDSLWSEVRKKIITYRSILTKIKYRETHLRTQSKIIKQAIEPGQMIITNRNYKDEGAKEWFHVDEIRGAKGYVFRGRLISILFEGRILTDISLFMVHSTTMRASRAAGRSWGSPKPVSSILGELIVSGINLKHILDITANQKLDKKRLFALSKEKGWAEIYDQIVKINEWCHGKGFLSVDRQLYDIPPLLMRDERIVNQLEIKWNEEEV